MEFNEFEKGLSDKFEHYNPLVDNDKIWASLEESLDKPKVSLAKYLAGILVFLAIISGCIIYYSMDNQTTKDAFSKDALNPSVKQEASIQAVKDVNGPGKASLSHVKPSKVIDRQVKDQEQLILKEEITTKNARKDLNLNTAKNLRGSTVNIDLNPAVATRSQSETYMQSKVVDPSIVGPNKSNTSRSTLVLNPLDATKSEQLKIANRTLAFNSFVLNPLKDRQSKDRAKTNAVQMFAGIYANQIISNASTNQGTSLQAKRSLAERHDAAYQLGLQYSFALNNHFSLFTGLSYLRNQTEFIQQTSLEETFHEDDYLIETKTLMDGTIEEIRGPALITRTTHRVDHYFNTHEQLSIPLGLQYHLKPMSRLSLSSGIAIAIPVFFQLDGYELEADDSIYDLSVDAASRYKKTGSFSLNLTSNLNYLFTNSWAIQAGLSAQYGLNSFNTNQAIVTKKQHLLGVTLGLTHNFKS